MGKECKFPLFTACEIDAREERTALLQVRGGWSKKSGSLLARVVWELINIDAAMSYIVMISELHKFMSFLLYYYTVLSIENDSF